MEKKKRTKLPIPMPLLEGPTFWPDSGKPGSVLRMNKVIMRREGTKLVECPVEFVAIMPPSKDKDDQNVDEFLPELQHREVIDALIILFANAGMPENNTITFKVTDVLKVLGKERAGKNYRVIYEAIVKYYRMEMKFVDRFNQTRGKRGSMPFETAVRIIASYTSLRPDTWDNEAGIKQQIMVKFESWFADTLRAKNEVLFVEQALLLAIGVGYTRRVYEVIRKGMGDSPVFKIGLEKLGNSLPFVKDLQVRRQVETLKRAAQQLIKIGAFSKVEFQGKGLNIIVVFFAPGGSQEVGEPDAEFSQLFGRTQDQAERTLHRAEKIYNRAHLGPKTEVLDRRESNYQNIVGELMYFIMTNELKGNRDGKSVGETLNMTKLAVQAVLSKYNPDPDFARDVLVDTKVAYESGKIKTTIRQYFIDQLKHGRY